MHRVIFFDCVTLHYGGDSTCACENLTSIKHIKRMSGVMYTTTWHGAGNIVRHGTMTMTLKLGYQSVYRCYHQLNQEGCCDNPPDHVQPVISEIVYDRARSRLLFRVMGEQLLAAICISEKGYRRTVQPVHHTRVTAGVVVSSIWGSWCSTTSARARCLQELLGSTL
jgi:hypothetical protein